MGGQIILFGTAMKKKVPSMLLPLKRSPILGFHQEFRKHWVTRVNALSTSLLIYIRGRLICLEVLFIVIGRSRKSRIVHDLSPSHLWGSWPFLGFVELLKS